MVETQLVQQASSSVLLLEHAWSPVLLLEYAAIAVRGLLRPRPHAQGTRVYLGFQRGQM